MIMIHPHHDDTAEFTTPSHTLHLPPHISPQFHLPLTPDPDFVGDSELPTKDDDEYRPFIRKLPEFQSWYAATCALSLATVCTLLPFLDVPVFWPILVVYYIMFFVGSMRVRIKHMIRHRYLPMSWGKPSFRKSSN